jgi:hypothetical protein
VDVLGLLGCELGFDAKTRTRCSSGGHLSKLYVLSIDYLTFIFHHDVYRKGNTSSKEVDKGTF